LVFYPRTTRNNKFNNLSIPSESSLQLLPVLVWLKCSMVKKFTSMFWLDRHLHYTN
jgi:hypothetical protein